MAQPQPIQIDPVWTERWQNQSEYLENLATFYSPEAKRIQETRVQTTLYTLVQCLKAFAQEQIDFFIDGFSRGSLAPSNEFPPEAVFSILLDQIGFDISVIERAAEQRIRCFQIKQDNPEDPYCNALAKGDYLTYEALKPASEAGLLREETTVLTYFRKSALVRVIPYAPVVLVGIPHTCINVPRDFLAIPHEVGHYVYRHGRFTRKNGQIITENFPVDILSSNTNSWVKSWFEEIFADVYGTLIAGPVIGMDFQDLQMRSTIEDFYNDDDDHPVPILRPYIYNNVTAKLSSPWSYKLHDNWQAYLQKRDPYLPDNVKEGSGRNIKRKFKRRNGNRFDVGEAITISGGGMPSKPVNPLDKAVHDIQEILLKDVIPTSWPKTVIPPATNDQAQALYKQFDNFVATIQTSEAIPDLTLDENNTILVNGNPTRNIGETIFRNRVDNTRDVLKRQSSNVISSQEWLRVLATAGWATKGPVCEGSGGVCK